MTGDELLARLEAVENKLDRILTTIADADRMLREAAPYLDQAEDMIAQFRTSNLARMLGIR